MDVFPDLERLSDADLKALTERKMDDERDVSGRRRSLHDSIDEVRREHTRRLKDLHGAIDVDAQLLSEAIARRAPGIAPDHDTVPERPGTIVVAELSNAELRTLLQQRTHLENELSFQRRMLHGHIDLLRAEVLARLRHRDGNPSEHLAAIDVDSLSEILAHRGPPLELPGELDRLD